MEFTQVSGPECGVERGSGAGARSPRAGRGRSPRGCRCRAGAGGGGACAASPWRAARGVYLRGPRFAFPAARSGISGRHLEENSHGSSQAMRAKPAPCIRWRCPPDSRIRGPRSSGGGSTSTARRRGSVLSTMRSSSSRCCRSRTPSREPSSRSSTTRPKCTATIPGRPLPAEITHLTGLTDDDVGGSGLTSRRRARSSSARASSWRTTRGSTGRSSSGCSRPRARGPGRARARRFRGPRRASRARRCIASCAPVRGLRPGPAPRARGLRGGGVAARAAPPGLGRLGPRRDAPAGAHPDGAPVGDSRAVRVEGGASRTGLPVDAGDAGRDRALVVDRRRAR